MKSHPIALIGVGLMGHGLAKNILKGGYSLHYLDHPGNQPDQDLRDMGAQPHHNYASLCQSCSVVLLCVTGSNEVDQILNPEALLPHLAPQSVIIDHSTGTPEKTLALLPLLEQYQLRYLDAPMTKTPAQAEEGTLNVLLGGKAGEWDDIISILQCYAENICYVGNIGDGQRAKLLHNFVSIGFATLMAEAAALAQSQNIDSEVLCQVWEQGGGRGAILDRLKPMILSGDASGFQFTLSNAAKDLGYYQEMAQSVLPYSSMSEPLHQLLTDVESRHQGRTLSMLIDILRP